MACLCCASRPTRLVMHRSLLSVASIFSRSSSSLAAPLSDRLLPTLVSKARRLEKQHGLLSDKLKGTYDISISRRVGEMAKIVESLRRWDTVQKSIGDLRALMDDPQTESELRMLAVDDMNSLTHDANQAVRSLFESMVPTHPFAHLPCLVEIRPGVGGVEAAIFARDIQRMYQLYCQQNNTPCAVLKEHFETIDTEESLHEAILEIDAPFAYQLLRCESGVHRVQRVPATEAKGRVHTSTVAVMVLPLFPTALAMSVNDPAHESYIDSKEVKREFMRANGAGGQHVNKTESAVRLTHIPTNIVVSMQDSRSRHQNEEKAWVLLRSRVAQLRREQKDEDMKRLRRSVVGVAKIGRADKIRTYNWQQQRVTDHRSGLTIHGLNGVLNGEQNLTALIDSARQWQSQLDLEATVEHNQFEIPRK